MSSRSVGIRELKDHASEILDARERLDALVQAGIIAYRGGKPRGLSDARGRSPEVSAAVVEDRR